MAKVIRGRLFGADFDQGFVSPIIAEESTCVKLHAQVQTHESSSRAGGQRSVEDPLIVSDLDSAALSDIVRDFLEILSDRKRAPCVDGVSGLLADGHEHRAQESSARGASFEDDFALRSVQ